MLKHIAINLGYSDWPQQENHHTMIIYGKCNENGVILLKYVSQVIAHKTNEPHIAKQTEKKRSYNLESYVSGSNQKNLAAGDFQGFVCIKSFLIFPCVALLKINRI